MNELALFAGAGGGLLASQHLLGHRTVCYVEREPYCVDVLKARIADGVLDDAPIWDDVRTFDGTEWRGVVACVSGGFPCQPFSVAGKQAADLDERNCWPDTVRIIREVQPEWCFLENVPGLLSARHRYFGTILGDLAESGFDVAWKVLSAAEVGACHLRKRLWIVAHAASERGGPDGDVQAGRDAARIGGTDVPDAIRTQCEQGTGGRGVRQGDSELGDSNVTSTDALATESRSRGAIGEPSWWDTEPAVGRVAHGVAHRVDRLRAIGNGQVPLVAATAWRLLTE